MPRDARYDVLFEPVAIGPVTAKNRFYQVPHCNGGGYRDPSAVAAMRNVKAEGGWAVVFTEQVELHHSSEITPFIELRLWDARDIPMLAKMADKIHEHGALAGIELAYSGINGPNLYSREVPMAPTALPVQTFTYDPVQARAMTRRDIAALRRWHRQAFRRAKTAGFDVICLYGAHGFGVIQHFLSAATNQRNDEYGGSLENRSRLLRELVAEGKDEVGDTCAISVRLALQDSNWGVGYSNDELREVIAINDAYPDLWDLAHGAWEDCSGPSRYTAEGAQEEMIRGLKAITTKPVVGVGRFTSPDTMVRQVNTGVLDFIGAARPSIADPFLPQKIADGRVEDIRECIGCNICVAGDLTMSISRCTQNPTFMEEWRKGWHPETIAAKGASESVLVVGAGPAGLEAARALGLRGYRVVLAEAGTELGGRVARECRLPGLSAWGRVRDYRQGQIAKLANVETYFASRLTATEIMEFGFEHVAIATGAVWRRDGVGHFQLQPLPLDSRMPIYTPDDLMAGNLPTGHVVVYDDDHYYMGGVLTELLIDKGCTVTFATPSAFVSEWARNTFEQHRVQAKLVQWGVDIRLSQGLVAVNDGHVRLACVYSGKEVEAVADALVLVTSRQGDDQLWHDLLAREAEWHAAGISTVQIFGDAQAPAPIAWATYAGHRYARELDTPDNGDEVPFRREVAELKA